MVHRASRPHCPPAPASPAPAVLSADSAPATTEAIVVLGTGGTISCTHAPNGDLVPTLKISDVIRQAGLGESLLAELEPAPHSELALGQATVSESPHQSAGQRLASRNVTIVPQDIIQLDSSSISLSDIDQLLNAIHRAMNFPPNGCRVIGVVVVHGTDTMEDTAFAADQLLRPHVPVVFTGAQRPADDPSPDGPANLRAAVDFIIDATAPRRSATDDAGASLPLGQLLRPHIVFGGTAIPAWGAAKLHTVADGGFGSVATDGDSAAQFTAQTIASASSGTSDAPPQLAGLRVGILEACAGADERDAMSWLRFTEDLDGVVVTAMGSGNIPAPLAPAVLAIADRIPVMLATRVPFGGVHLVYGGGGGGAELGRAGVASAGPLRPSQARMLLLTRLARQRHSTPAN